MLTTMTEIGNRLQQLRKAKKLSQAELAQQLNMSRSVWIQIEAGKRNLSALELIKLSETLQIPILDFISDSPTTQQTNTQPPNDTYERIPEPNLNLQKLQNVLLYLFERCAGNPNITETALCIFLYFADFNHYEVYHHYITGAAYHKIDGLPVPMQLNTVLADMEHQKLITIIKTMHNNLPQRRFIPLQKANLTQINASEYHIIDTVLQQLLNMPEIQLKAYAQNDMPLRATQNKEWINYELAMYREPPYVLVEDTEEF